MEEEVLVFPAALLERLGLFHGFSAEVDRYLPELLDEKNLSYLPRGRAEDDPRHKQLIPYIVLRSGDTVYCYERGKSGGEARLHRLWSLGVGGHICRQDGARGPAAYAAGFARELDEEVEIDAEFESRIVGMVYDERTPVGSVHFGIIHLLDLTAPRVRHRDPALANARFQAIADVRRRRDAFETWSGFVIDHVLAAT
jgi:predicted NUDIX family phosphoesterase